MNSHYKKEDFTREVKSMVLQLEARINDFSHELDVEKNNQANQKEAGDMNVLKLQRYKMKEMLVAMETMDDETWRSNRERFKADVEKAEESLMSNPEGSNLG